MIYYWNYRLEKSEILKSSKKPVSKHLWTVNMLKDSKDCLNLDGSVFVIFLDNSERKLAPWKLF